MQKILAKSIIIVEVVGQLLFLYGLLGWAYGVLMQFRNPKSLTYPLSHLTTWLRVDTFAIASFIVSALGFFMWRLTKEFVDSTDKSQT